MTNTCTLVTVESVRNSISLFKECEGKDEKDIAPINRKQLNKFFSDIEHCPLFGETFFLLIEERDLCYKVARNQNLTPAQIMALPECKAMESMENTGNEQLFKSLLSNKGNNHNSLSYLEIKEKSVLNEHYLTGE